MLIFLTIIYFGNEMTAESAGGVVVVVCGVGLYNWARVRYPAPAADDEVPSAGDKDDTGGVVAVNNEVLLLSFGSLRRRRS